METSWTINVDRGRCVGSGSCIVYAPSTFSQDEEAKAVVIDLVGDPLERIRTAVEACPADALDLISNEGA